MQKSRLAFLFAITLAAFACNQQPQPPAAPPSDAHVKSLADTFLAASFERNPEQITQFGIPNHRQDKRHRQLSTPSKLGKPARTPGSPN